MSNPLLWLTDFAILAGLLALGILIVRMILPGSTISEQIALGFGLGVGLVTWVLFLISWGGIPLNGTTIGLTYSVLLVLSFLGSSRAVRKVSADKVSRITNPRKLHDLPDLLGWILFGIFGFLLFVISIGLSYYNWDAMAIWSVKGYGIGLEQSIFGGEQWGAKGLAYPLNIPLAISIFFTANQDALPGSKLLVPGLYLATLIGLRVLFQKQHIPAWLAWCAVFAIGTVPLLLQYSLIGYANIPYAYYYVSGVIWISLGLDAKDSQRILVGAILLALSIWTRLEGLEFWPIAILCLALIWRSRLFAKTFLWRITIPALLIGGSWLLFTRIYNASTGETIILSEAISRILHGEFHPAAIYQILRFTGYLALKTWGYGILVPLVTGLAFLIIIIDSKARKELFPMSLLMSGSLTGVGVMLMYYLTSYDGSSDLLSWLGTGYDRMLFPAVILLATGSLIILWRTWQRNIHRESSPLSSD